MLPAFGQRLGKEKMNAVAICKPAFQDPISFIEQCVQAGGSARMAALALVTRAAKLAEATAGKSLFELALSRLDGRRSIKNKSFRRDMPYCFLKLSGGGWLPLNRYYEVLGHDAGDTHDHERFADRAWRFPTDPREIAGVWFKVGNGCLWLYNDNWRSRKDYFARLGRLMGVAAPGAEQ